MRFFPRLRRIIHWLFRLLLVLLVIDSIYLAAIWPDWQPLAGGAIPRSNFMAEYQEQQRHNKNWPNLLWQPVSLAIIPHNVVRAVLVAEDSRFYSHSGFDLIAIREALDYNFAEGRFVLGASTISQQTAKNLFLSPDRTPWRKWHELILTFALEQNLSKQRILEIYLNTAEFGRGIYGVEAAAQAYWGMPVSQLSLMQAVELAATLPGPTKHNPALRTVYFINHTQKIVSLLANEFDLENDSAIRASKPEQVPVEERSIKPGRSL
jgi:monofunctional biosynthetic peptidoglycan transglycosylase